MAQSKIPCNCKLVVIIDDNEVDGFIAKTFINESGFTGTLKVFASAYNALDFLKDVSGGNTLMAEDLLIFLDLHMPEASGLDFLLALQETKPSFISRVCILSSEYEEIQRKVVKDLPVAGFISKPFNMEKIHTLLKRNSSAALEA